MKLFIFINKKNNNYDLFFIIINLFIKTIKVFQSNNLYL